MAFEIIRTRKLAKDLLLEEARGYDLRLIGQVVDTPPSGKPLGGKHKDHPLCGNFTGLRECHITPDWLLIYRIEKSQLQLILTRTGTHSDLYRVKPLYAAPFPS